MEKKFLLILKTSAFAQAGSREALDLMLAIAGNDCKLSLLFIEDGIFQLLPKAKPTTKDITACFKALKFYDIEAIWVSKADLQERKLNHTQFVMPVTPLSDIEIQQLMQRDVTILNF